MALTTSPETANFFLQHLYNLCLFLPQFFFIFDVSFFFSLPRNGLTAFRSNFVDNSPICLLLFRKMSIALFDIFNRVDDEGVV